MAEMAGDAAIAVDASDVDAIRDALATCVAGGPDAEQRRAAGIARAAGYTWEACARGHVEAYRSTLAG
jgi:alpha-1,3-rhamnosyl/mannosyltransferase